MSATTKKYTIECEADNARKFWNWIQTRGGVAKWQSENLSNPSASWSSPATIRRGDYEGPQASEGSPDDILPYPKPTWQAGNNPTVVTSPKEIGVFVSKLYKAFPVGLRSGSGFSTVITDAAQRKVDKYLDECNEKHGDSFYKKGVLDIDGASIGIYYTESIVPLDEWITKNGIGNPEDYATSI